MRRCGSTSSIASSQREIFSARKDFGMGDSFLSSVLSVVLQLLGVLVGGLITWWYSRRYYMLAARELRSEVVGLHTALNTVVNAVRQDKDALIELQRDGAGRLT